MSEKITGSEALIKSLITEGVDTIFGYPGGQIMPVYDKLYDYTDRLKHILVRHEQGAMHAAQGYARMSGRPGVVIVTSGPGATNVITGLSDAQMDSTPLVVITGQVDSRVLGSDAFQETDFVGITQSIAKWVFQIRNADDISMTISRAFYIASTGRPGPVVLDITKDAQTGMTEWQPSECKFMRSYQPAPEPDAGDLNVVAKLLNAAERPLILSGHGVMIAGAEPELLSLAEKADIPVATTLLGLSTIPSGHRLNKGMLGMHGNIGPNVNTNRADLIIAVGMRFDDRVTGDLARYAPQAKIVHIDIDKSEFNKSVKAYATVHADAKQALGALIPLTRPARHPQWNDSFAAAAAVERARVIGPELHRTSGPLTMGEVVSKVSEMTHHKAVLVTDVGQNQMMSARYFRYTEPRSIVTSGGLGTMGFGLPAAIGAKIASPGRQVTLFTGDGGMQMTIQELGTIMQYGVAIKIILLNNDFLGNVRQWQELFFNGRFSQTPMLNPDFVALADAYGIKGETVAKRDELDAAVRRMLDHNGPYLLNVHVDCTDNVFPMTPPGASVDTIMLNSSEYYSPN